MTPAHHLRNVGETLAAAGASVASAGDTVTLAVRNYSFMWFFVQPFTSV
jgi:hypothetical protein